MQLQCFLLYINTDNLILRYTFKGIIPLLPTSNLTPVSALLGRVEVVLSVSTTMHIGRGGNLMKRQQEGSSHADKTHRFHYTATITTSNVVIVVINLTPTTVVRRYNCLLFVLGWSQIDTLQIKGYFTLSREAHIDFAILRK